MTGVVNAAVSDAVAQFMAARFVGASPQVDGRSQQPGQRDPVVRQSIAGPEEENKDGEKKEKEEEEEEEDDMSVDLGPFPQQRARFLHFQKEYDQKDFARAICPT